MLLAKVLPKESIALVATSRINLPNIILLSELDFARISPATPAISSGRIKND